jgi:hypothetical protein
MTIEQVETDLHGILFDFEEPAEIEAEVVRLLTGVGHESFGAIRRIAGDISRAIAGEHEMQDPDMMSVIPRLDAVLSPAVRLAGAGGDVMTGLVKYDAACRAIAEAKGALL